MAGEPAADPVASPAAAPSGRAARGSGARAPGLYPAVVALLALVYFGAVLLATGAPGPALRSTALAVVPGVGFAFVLLRIGRRVRWFDGTRRRLAILHAALGLGYSAAWSATVVVLFA